MNLDTHARKHRTREYNENYADKFKDSYFKARSKNYGQDSIWSKHFELNSKQFRIANVLNYLLSKKESGSLTDTQIAWICECDASWVYLVRQKLILMGLIQHIRNSDKKKSSYKKWLYIRLIAITNEILLKHGWNIDFTPSEAWQLKQIQNANAPPDQTKLTLCEPVPPTTPFNLDNISDEWKKYHTKYMEWQKDVNRLNQKKQPKYEEIDWSR